MLNRKSCKNCHYYHGQNRVHCANYPEGISEPFCTDWQKIKLKRNIKVSRLIRLIFRIISRSLYFIIMTQQYFFSPKCSVLFCSVKTVEENPYPILNAILFIFGLVSLHLLLSSWEKDLDSQKAYTISELVNFAWVMGLLIFAVFAL
jgi:hypothetical protein